MSTNRLNVGPLIGGSILLALGLLTLAGQFFTKINFWGVVWPFLVIGFGALFFVGMFASGKSSSGLAIPGAIISMIGLMLLLQNLLGHWESWAYGWTVIIFSVGLGMYISGRYGEIEEQRQSGLRVMKVGAILFVIFGGFFEMIFDSLPFSRFLFPLALIALGVYLILVRSGMLRGRDETVNTSSNASVDSDVEPK